jgi:hypothetical protein
MALNRQAVVMVWLGVPTHPVGALIAPVAGRMAMILPQGRTRLYADATTTPVPDPARACKDQDRLPLGRAAR